MAWAGILGFLALIIIIPPFSIILLTVIVLASFGKSLGIRERYVKYLLKIFEFGKERLAKHKTRPEETELSDTDDEIQSTDPSERGVILKSSRDINKEDDTHEFQLDDCFNYIRIGMEVIVDDEVTKRFSAEELQSWNLLTRTNLHYEFISVRLTIFWVLGCIFRYCVLFPLRLIILFIGVGSLIMSTLLVGLFPEGDLKKKMNIIAFKCSFRILVRGFSGVFRFHNRQNKPKTDGICVANHTSPIDCAVLACDSGYSFVGQRHFGFLGILQRALSRASAHIWFERCETKDRFAVARRLREHVEDPEKLPILIFPEGTCINNTSVMQFKKGTFEVGGVIYPVAIKYDPRFGDAFWNSSKYSIIIYLYMMMTSWAIVCDVWYLPPMTREENESAIDFANRVKAAIAHKGGLVDLVWDGGLKRSAPKKEYKEHRQEEFRRRLKIHETKVDKSQEEKNQQ